MNNNKNEKNNNQIKLAIYVMSKEEFLKMDKYYKENNKENKLNN